MGLSAFALTTFVLSLINCEARGVTIPNIVVGLAFFYGGAAQLVAGMFELAVGNTFGGVALSSYGGFWGAWAAIQVDSFGIKAAYANNTEELHYAGDIFNWLVYFHIFLDAFNRQIYCGILFNIFLLSITFYYWQFLILLVKWQLKSRWSVWFNYCFCCLV